MNTKFRIAAYIALVGAAFVAAAIFWEFVAPRRWFYCDDSIGFSFIPPFAHTDVARYGQTGDYYILSPSVVYSIWASLVAACFILPALIVFVAPRLHRQEPQTELRNERSA